MLKKKAIRKIFITTVTVCLLLAIYLMPSSIGEDASKSLKKDIKVNYVDDKEKVNFFLLNEDDLLVKTSTVVDKDKDLIEKAKLILKALINSDSALLPDGLSRIIPKNSKVLDLQYSEGIITINFSKQIEKVDEKKREKMLEAITFSLIELQGVNGVKIKIDNKNIKDIFEGDLPEVFTRDYGINKKYDIKSTKNIQKVIVYYTMEIENDKYYVPITKYMDDPREKINIIVDSLSSNYIYEPNLVSFLNQNTELINYEIDKDTMILNFNNSIFMNKDTILEEVVYTIMYSVFDNYEVEEVVIQVENEETVKKNIKDIVKIN